MSVSVPAIIIASFKLNILVSSSDEVVLGSALRNKMKAHTAKKANAMSVGNIMSLNHVKLIPTTIIKVCTNVETHDINAAPAFVFAFARPERTSKPRLAMVAVLETKPEAKEESNKAFLEDKSRFAICARACTNKINVSNFKIT
ncbi:Uncharacterised protein [Acinetobacter baumannii]|nr:Uncharacterised protein [Acinetobacter baumannii]